MAQTTSVADKTQETSIQSDKKANKEKIPLTPAKKKKRKKLIKRIIIIAIVIALLAWYFVPKMISGKTEQTSTYKLSQVEKRDITVTLSGSATVQPKDSYTLTSLVSGEILSDTFSENDHVEEDQLLYVIDSSDVSTNISKAQNSLSKSQMSYSDSLDDLANLNVKAGISGVVKEVYVEDDDEIQAGTKIAYIVNDDTLKITLPFNSYDVENMWVGEKVTLTVESNFETIEGKISSISALKSVSSGNTSTRNVEITVNNPGLLTDTLSATGKIGNVYSTAAATFEYSKSETVTAKVKGDVSALKVKEGDKVKSGSTIVRLENSSLQTQIDSNRLNVSDAQLSLQNTYDKLDNYNITSPIAGTVVYKALKAGESISENNTLAIIYDMSTLEFELAIDELDISQIKVGQEVNITADAIDGETFKGNVTKVSVVGTTTNGVTTYPVTVSIQEPGDLLPGMNVEASIIVQQKKDVLAVPISAVQRGNSVLLYKGTDEKNLDENSFETKEVKLGMSDDDYIEIVDGLKENEKIGIVSKKLVANKNNIMEQGMSNDMGPSNDSSARSSGGYQSSSSSSTNRQSSSSSANPYASKQGGSSGFGG